MKTSQVGIDLIKKEELFMHKAYRCPAGVLTIGYGHTRGVKEGDMITKAQGEEFLKEDLQYAESVVNAQKLNLSQNQFDALVSFVFNVGSGNFQKSTLLKKAKVNSNDLTIANEFAKWNKAKDKTGKLVELNGLTNRRKKESDLYFKK